MRSIRRLPMQTGTSVIAAIVVAAILGGIALGLHAIESNSANTAALQAQASATVTASRGQAQTPAQIQQLCNTAIAELKTSGASQTPTQTVPYPTTDKSQIKNNCIAAVSNAGQYKCVGETEKVAIVGTGLITVASPNPQQQPGSCKAESCSSTTINTSKDCPLDTSSYPNLGIAGAGSGTPVSATITPDVAASINSSCTASGGTVTCPGQNPSDVQNSLNAAGYNYTCNTLYNQANPDGAAVCTQSVQPAPPAAAQCPTGETGTPPNCTTGGGGNGGNGNGGNGNGGNNSGNANSGNSSNSLSPLTSFLSGLAKGLTSSNCYSTNAGGNGTTLVPVQTVNAYGQVQTTYVQSTQPTGVTSSGQPCTPQQQAPYGVGSNGAACTAPPAQPQCAAGATAMPISASGNGCVTSYQCVPINGSTFNSTPTPQISCSPQVADVGQSVAVTYSCQNATGSSGGGFTTNNQLSGTASTTITAPPAGNNTANFGLTCTNNGQTASAQCSVQINQPAIDLVADPQAVPSGQTSSIGWVTAGMQSCVISSPDDATFTSANAGNTSVSGVAQSDAITGPTTFTLTCQTLGGQTKTASTQVTIGSGSSAPAAGENLTVNSSVDGQTANHGSTVTINWQSTNAPSGSALSIWLIDVGTEQATALIAGQQPVNGSYQWQIPAVGTACDPNSIAPCASELVAGDSYGIEAALYTPSSAYLGGSPEPSGAVSPSYSQSSYTATPFTLGQ